MSIPSYPGVVTRGIEDRATRRAITRMNKQLQHPPAGVAGAGIVEVSDGNTVPDVTGGRTLLITNNASATAITDLVGGVNGQEVTIFFRDGSTTVVNNAALIDLAGVSNFVPAALSTLTLIRFDDVWHEKARKAN